MKKKKIKKPYEDVTIEVLNIQQNDVITTSEIGDSGYDPGSWT